jgi:hypothetical protein
MKNINEILKEVLLSSLFLLAVLFILRAVNSSFPVDINFFIKTPVLFLLAIALVNVKKIKYFIFKNPKGKKIALFSVVNFLISLIILFIYSVFQGGSPLIFEDRIPNFKATKQIEITEKPIIQTFTAKSNNLETMGIKLIAKREIPEITPEDFSEDEQTSANNIRLLFRLKEQGSDNYIYQNTYEFSPKFESSFYPFGFPAIANSKGKTYVVQISRKKQDEDIILTSSSFRFLLESNGSSVNYYPRYVYSLKNLKVNYSSILKNLLRTFLLCFQSTKLFILFHVLVFSTLAFLFIYSEKLFNKYCRYWVLLGIFFISLSIFFRGSLELFNKALENYLFILTCALLLFFYKMGQLDFSLLVNFPKKKVKTNRFDFIKEKWFLLLTLITLWGGVLRFYNIGNFDIYHDEYFYASAIKSYVEAGSTNLWNYATNSPSQKPYSRFITILVGNFIKLVGYNETNLRLPFALFGTLSVFFLFFLTKELTGSNLISLSASLMLSLDDISIYLSRFIRQYSLLTLVSILLAWFMIKSIKRISKDKNVKPVELLLPILIIVFSFNYISPFIISFTPTFLLYVIYIVFNCRNKKVRFFSLSLCALLFVVFLLDYFKLFSVINLRHVLENNLIIGFEETRTGEYFDWTFGRFKIPIYFVFLMTIFSSITLLIKKKFENMIFVSFFWLPYLFLNFNLYHSYDFRYVSFFLPFLFILVSYTISAIIPLTTKSLSNKKLLLFGCYLLVFILMPSFPKVNIKNLTLKAQGDWILNEGVRIHRRAVAPEYKRAFSFLNQEEKEGDTLIIVDGVQYLKAMKGANYFSLDPWSGSREILNLENSKATDFFDQMSNSRGKTFVIGAYFHLLNKEILDYLFQNCNNLSKSLGIKRFIYNDYYTGKNLFWPNIFICKQ